MLFIHRNFPTYRRSAVESSLCYHHHVIYMQRFNCTTIKLFFVLNNTSIHDRSYAIKITFLCRSLGIAPKSPFLLRLIRFTVTISRTRVCAFFLPPQHHSTRSPLPSIHHTLTGRLLICTIIIVERMSSSDRHPVRNIQRDDLN